MRDENRGEGEDAHEGQSRKEMNKPRRRQAQLFRPPHALNLANALTQRVTQGFLLCSYAHASPRFYIQKCRPCVLGIHVHHPTCFLPGVCGTFADLHRLCTTLNSELTQTCVSCNVDNNLNLLRLFLRLLAWTTQGGQKDRI